MTGSGESGVTRAHRDPMFRQSYLSYYSGAYCGDLPADHPGCSPLFADLRGLPPLLIQVGSEEVLYSDAERLFHAAQAAGVDATFECYDGLWHAFQLFVGFLPESTEAINEIGKFLRRHF